MIGCVRDFYLFNYYYYFYYLPKFGYIAASRRQPARAQSADEARRADDALAERLDAADVAGFFALSLFCCERENATNGSSMSHLRQRPTRGADIAARGGSTTARKFAIVPSRRARAGLLQ